MFQVGGTSRSFAGTQGVRGLVTETQQINLI